MNKNLVEKRATKSARAENISSIFLALIVIVAVTWMVSLADSNIQAKKIAAICEASLQNQFNGLIINTEKFLLDTTGEVALKPIPATNDFKMVTEYSTVDASCPASTAYKGEKYEFTYIDTLTNKETTVTVPKKLVTLEQKDKNEIPSVKVVSHTIKNLSSYQGLLKPSELYEGKVEINTYIVRL